MPSGADTDSQTDIPTHEPKQFQETRHEPGLKIATTLMTCRNFQKSSHQHRENIYFRKKPLDDYLVKY